MMNSVTKYLIWTTTRRSKYDCVYIDDDVDDDDALNVASIDWFCIDDVDDVAHYVISADWFCE